MNRNHSASLLSFPAVKADANIVCLGGLQQQGEMNPGHGGPWALKPLDICHFVAAQEEAGKERKVCGAYLSEISNTEILA